MIFFKTYTKKHIRKMYKIRVSIKIDYQEHDGYCSDGYNYKDKSETSVEILDPTPEFINKYCLDGNEINISDYTCVKILKEALIKLTSKIRCNGSGYCRTKTPEITITNAELIRDLKNEYLEYCSGIDQDLTKNDIHNIMNPKVEPKIEHKVEYKTTYRRVSSHEKKKKNVYCKFKDCNKVSRDKSGFYTNKEGFDTCYYYHLNESMVNFKHRCSRHN